MRFTNPYLIHTQGSPNDIVIAQPPGPPGVDFGGFC